MSIQVLLIEAGALSLLTSTFVLVRRRMLSVRYGLGWLTVSSGGVVAAPLLQVFATQAKRIGFTPTGFSLGVFIMFLVLLCLQLSVSLSGLHGAVQALSEYSALLEERVRRLEGERTDTETAAGADRQPEYMRSRSSR